MNKSICLLFVSLALMACRTTDEEPDLMFPPSGNPGKIVGFYLLNEGPMGSNKSTIDYYDYSTGIYTKNICAAANPDLQIIPGDVGNDIQIYGSRLYAVINRSNNVLVMDAQDARYIGQVPVRNCRYIVFHDRYAYVSSYADALEMDPGDFPGYVVKIDTATMEVVDTCIVGNQPEEMVIANGKLYVANSGIYRVPNYDHTVSVIDLDSFKETGRIDVAINLHRMELDSYGQIWVSSRGDDFDCHSQIYVISSENDQVICDFGDIPCNDMALCGDSLYVISYTYNFMTVTYDICYYIVDVKQNEIISSNFITDGTEQDIQAPYGIAVNPQTHEILITDALDQVTPGTLYCFSPDGQLKWQCHTGDIPSRIVFYKK